VLALRRVPARFFGVFMSVNPVFAALAGLVILGQSLGLADWLAISVIVAVNAVTAGAGTWTAAARARYRARMPVNEDPAPDGGRGHDNDLQ